MLVLLCARGAHASSFPFPLEPDPVVFEAVSTPATGICPEPCFEVRVFLEDPTRSVDIQSIQFDIDVAVGARVAPQPVPPETNSNARAGNVVFFSEEDARAVPWDLSATVGASPDRGFEVLMVEAAALSFTVDSLASLRRDFGGCVPARACAIFDDALLWNRIYLGSFKVSRDGDPATRGFEVRIGNVTGVGRLMEMVQQAHSYPRYAFVAYPVPEPTTGLFGASLCAFAALRARFRRRASPAGSAVRR